MARQRRSIHLTFSPRPVCFLFPAGHPVRREVYSAHFAFRFNGTQNTTHIMALDPDQIIRFSPLHRLQWEEAQQKFVILYPEGMVELNQSSAEILKLCDGAHNLAQIVDELEQKFQASGLSNDITAFLHIALQNGWIQQH